VDNVVHLVGLLCMEFGVLTSFAYPLEDGSGEWVWRAALCA